jgi:hypothetical protein
MMTTAQICRIIENGQLNDQDLNSVIAAVKYARRHLQRQVTSSLMVGDRVSFTSSRSGQTMTGKVTKIAIKYVTVSVPGWGSWKVPANMLTRVEDPVAA